MQKLQKELSEICEKEKIAGMAVAVTDRSGIRFASGFGVESIERPEVPVTPTSLFRIASITKIFTGITVMGLVEEGKLSLDAPVKEILPQLRLKDEEAARRITLRQLLSHTAGFPVEYTPDGAREESLLEEALMTGLSQVDLVGPPGKQYLYSNWGIRLASLMAQKVTGLPFTELVTQRVLNPLGTERTTFDLHVAATYPLCLAHTEENGVFRVYHRIEENATRHAAGGLFSNTVDLCRLARLLLNEGVTDSGERILSKASLDQMKTKHAFAPEFDGYGLTLLQDRYRDGWIYGHRGSAPPYATSLIVHPQSGLGIVVLMNTQRDTLRFSLPKRILDELLT